MTSKFSKILILNISYNMENAARVMQLNIQIPQTILFLMVHDTHHVNIIENILYTKIYIYILI